MLTSRMSGFASSVAMDAAFPCSAAARNFWWSGAFQSFSRAPPSCDRGRGRFAGRSSIGANSPCATRAMASSEESLEEPSIIPSS